MPNGRSIVLERQPAANAAGYSGLEDKVDNHFGLLFEAALLSTLLSELGTTSGTGSNSAGITALRQGSSDSLNQTGQTLTIRPGFQVRVIVNRDLVLQDTARGPKCGLGRKTQRATTDCFTEAVLI
jgi:type IV secretion system protein VirB10